MWMQLDVPPNPLISILIEQPQEVEPEQIYTIEEKIRDNYYECDEAIEYIRADNAQCLPKPVPAPSRVNTQVTTQNTSKTIVRASSAPSGWYPYGQCTWWVASKRTVGQWNNATDWLWQAERDGYATGTQARAGAIAWRYGHVAFVESVSGNMMTVSEANYDRRGSIRTITIPVSDYTAFIY